MRTAMRCLTVVLLALCYVSATGCVRHAPAAVEAPEAAPKHEDTCPFCKAKKAGGLAEKHLGEHDHEHCTDPNCPHDHDHDHAEHVAEQPPE